MQPVTQQSSQEQDVHFITFFYLEGPVELKGHAVQRVLWKVPLGM